MGQEALKDVFREQMGQAPGRLNAGELNDLWISLSLPALEVDWAALFRDFCQQHGEPVFFNNGWLLFPDSWQHSAVSHQGPILPPPSDPMAAAQLKQTYRQIRTTVLRRQWAELDSLLHRLRRLEAERGGLERVVRDGRGNVVRSEPLNLSELQDRLDWLAEQLQEQP